LEKIIRKSLCKDCLEKVRKLEANLIRKRRLKIKQSEKQVGGKVKVNKVI